MRIRFKGDKRLMAVLAIKAATGYDARLTTLQTRIMFLCGMARLSIGFVRVMS